MTATASITASTDGAATAALLPDLVGKRHPHIPALDGIRGLAILMVMAHHLFVFEVVNIRLVDGFFRVMEKGWAGVDLFFVLSGFLITTILLESKEHPHYFRNFYVRRALRIFPLYYLIVIGGLVVLPAIVRTIGGVSTVPDQNPAWFLFYGVNFLVTKNQSWGAGSPFIHLGQFWSLAVEEHFYLIWPLVIYVTPRRVLPYLASGVIVVVSAARAVWFLKSHDAIGTYSLTFFRVDALCWGALLSMLLASNRGRVLAARFGRPVLLVSGVALLCALSFTGFHRSARLVPIAGYPMIGVFFTALLYATMSPHRGNLCRGIFGVSWLRFFGKYSYGLYVYHFILLGMADTFHTDSWFEYILHSPSASHFASKCSATALSIGIAMLSYHFFEKPILGLKRFFPS